MAYLAIVEFDDLFQKNFQICFLCSFLSVPCLMYPHGLLMTPKAVYKALLTSLTKTKVSYKLPCDKVIT